MLGRSRRVHALPALLLLAPAAAAQLVLPASGQPPLDGSSVLEAKGRELLIVDVNADGHPDLVTEQSDLLRVALNNGHALFVTVLSPAPPWGCDECILRTSMPTAIRTP